MYVSAHRGHAATLHFFMSSFLLDFIDDQTVLMVLIGLGFTASNTAGNCSEVPPGYYVSIR